MKRTTLSLTIAVALFCAVQPVSAATIVSVTQTIEFPEVLPFGTFTEGTYLLPNWSSPFPFTSVGEINKITFEFSSTDPDYATAPLGGTSNVEIGVMSEDPTPIRTALSSVNPGSPFIIVTPLELILFPLVESLVLDGDMTMSLGAFETTTTSILPLTLDEPSFLTVTVEGELVPEPSTLALAAFAFIGFLSFASRRRRTA